MTIIMMNEEEFKKEFSDLYKKWNDEMQSIDRDVFDHAGWFDQINLYEEIWRIKEESHARGDVADERQPLYESRM